jgi:hypothetical protein
MPVQVLAPGRYMGTTQMECLESKRAVIVIILFATKLRSAWSSLNPMEPLMARAHTAMPLAFVSNG